MKLLYLVSTISDSYSLQTKETIRMMKKSGTIDVVEINDISIEIHDNSPVVYVSGKIFNFDFVYFTSWKKHDQIISALIRILEMKSIPFLCRSAAKPIHMGKIHQMVQFSLHKIPVPDTIYISSKRLGSDSFGKVQAQFNTPFIFKANKGSKGGNNFLISTEEEYLAVVKQAQIEDRQFIHQRYIENEFDYRIVCLSHVAQIAYKRIGDKDSSHLNNISQGGDSEIVELNSIAKHINIIEKASMLVQEEICGVDLLIDKNTKKPYILEANSSPGASKLQVATMIADYLITYPTCDHPQKYASIQELRDSMIHHYVRNLHRLYSYDFHFLSRMHLWSQDPQYLKLFSADIMNTYFGGNGLESVPEYIETKSQTLSIEPVLNESERRLPFLQKYNKLQSIHLAFFRLCFAFTIFQTDFRARLFTNYDQIEVDAMFESLLKDEDALSVLSTFAINSLYFYYGFIHSKIDKIDLNFMLRVAKTKYNFSDVSDLKLFVYFITHIVIGESFFYSKEIDSNRMEGVLKLLQLAEKVILNNFISISLDNKLEFLVACKIAHYSSTIEALIMNEALNSVSDFEPYLIDRHNIFAPKSDQANIRSSEHRSVLFLLATSPYRPLTKES